MDTRERLVRAAAELVAEGGTSAVTLREVGRRAGVSHNAAYKHFESRQQLLAAVAAAELRRLHKEMDAVRRSRATPLHRIERMLAVGLRGATERPHITRLTFGLEVQGSNLPELGEAATLAYDTFVAGVRDAQVAGDLPPGDPERLASLIRATATGAADLARNGHLSPGGKGHATPKQLVGDLLRYLKGNL